MSLEANRRKRLYKEHDLMDNLLSQVDLSGRQIETYRESLLRSLEALDAGLANQLFDAIRLIYGHASSQAGGDPK